MPNRSTLNKGVCGVSGPVRMKEQNRTDTDTRVCRWLQTRCSEYVRLT